MKYNIIWPLIWIEKVWKTVHIFIYQYKSFIIYITRTGGTPRLIWLHLARNIWKYAVCGFRRYVDNTPRLSYICHSWLKLMGDWNPDLDALVKQSPLYWYPVHTQYLYRISPIPRVMVETKDKSHITLYL